MLGLQFSAIRCIFHIVCVYIYMYTLYICRAYIHTDVSIEVQLSPSKLKSSRPCLVMDKIRLMPVELVSFLACIGLSN